MLREEREVVIASPVVFSADGSLSCTFFVSNTFSPDSVSLRENVLLNLFILRNYSPFCFLKNISRPGACFKHAHFFYYCSCGHQSIVQSLQNPGGQVTYRELDLFSSITEAGKSKFQRVLEPTLHPRWHLEYFVLWREGHWVHTRQNSWESEPHLTGLFCGIRI